MAAAASQPQRVLAGRPERRPEEEEMGRAPAEAERDMGEK